MPFLPHTEDIPFFGYWIIGIFALVLMVSSVIGILQVTNTKLIIDNEKISKRSIRSTKELYFNEIKGFRKEEKFIRIKSNTREKKDLEVTYTFEKNKEIVNWLSSRLPDLPGTNAKDEEAAILEDTTYGQTTHERERTLKNAKRISLIVNLLSLLVAMWVIIMPEPYVMLITLSMPIVVIGVILYYKGIIRVTSTKDSGYPFIGLGVLFPGLGLIVRCMMDFTIFSYSNVWLLSFIITILLFVVVLVGSILRYRPINYTDIIASFLFLCIYGFGATLTLNCLYDISTPETYKVQVLDKSVTEGKNTSYYLTLAPWEKQPEIDFISVDIAMYKRVKKEDKVTIYYKQGLLGIPWLIVTDTPQVEHTKE
ncbi:hypothetical protein QNI19_12355 [Cytophagaceae bacterium DM2B3-1]|uniref:DUF3592 domain-containing protein n=1 Tax=Xanthocytophaga flava TaxID=3048013 RepID=A0ABT7CJ23_9BACT|nr:hypothetical protein [Xanthocytophaga flavus]MDJ1467646.1 hypothetical protein [Xanthocytophaga flavus]MDJ1493726.1 hypothetical protein [Xanthocytophaga flavus]